MNSSVLLNADDSLRSGGELSSAGSVGPTLQVQKNLTGILHQNQINATLVRLAKLRRTTKHTDTH